MKLIDGIYKVVILFKKSCQICNCTLLYWKMFSSPVLATFVKTKRWNQPQQSAHLNNCFEETAGICKHMIFGLYIGKSLKRCNQSQERHGLSFTKKNDTIEE